jgi:signal peptidase I
MTDDSPPAQQGEAETQRVSWWAELRGLAAMLFAVLVFHSFIAKPFYIPSESMMPGLLVGDRLVVSKYPYGWNWSSLSFHVAPRAEWRLAGSTPEYGDVVILAPPFAKEDWIKRVVALPGDRIAVVNGQIVLNGKPVPQEVEPAIRLPIDRNSPCNPAVYPGMRARDDAGNPVCEMPTFRETLPNGATYLVVDHRRTFLDDFREITVPQGHVFLMGDNRDHSADSRDLSGTGLNGPVPLHDIGGRAEFITFSMDGTFGWNPLTWLGAFREGRAWTSLRPTIRDEGAQGAGSAALGE